jgi:hypothetical protein
MISGTASESNFATISARTQIVFAIVRNEFHLNRDTVFRIDRPAPSRLIVFNKEAKPTLDIEVFSNRVIVVVGDFHLRDGTHVVISEDAIIVNGMRYGRFISARCKCALQFRTY